MFLKVSSEEKGNIHQPFDGTESVAILSRRRTDEVDKCKNYDDRQRWEKRTAIRKSKYFDIIRSTTGIYTKTSPISNFVNHLSYSNERYHNRIVFEHFSSLRATQARGRRQKNRSWSFAKDGVSYKSNLLDL